MNDSPIISVEKFIASRMICQAVEKTYLQHQLLSKDKPCWFKVTLSALSCSARADSEVGGDCPTLLLVNG